MNRVAGVMVMVLFLGLTGCASMNASVDRNGAQAKDGSPTVADVPVLSIPYDAAYPTYVVVVEPMQYAAVDVISGSGPQSAPNNSSGTLGFLEGPGKIDMQRSRGSLDRHIDNAKMQNNRVGTGIAAQLMTALSNCGNIQVLEYENIKREADGTYSCKLEKGEIGPIIIRGVVTEFNETADLSEQKKGGSLGRVGAALGLLGAVTDSDTLKYGGTGLAIADPTMQKGDVKRKGVVAMDLRLINGRNGRLVGGFKSSGTFTTVSSVSGMSIFGIGKSGSEFAASALGQATRAAMNDAVQKSANLLKNKVHMPNPQG